MFHFSFIRNNVLFLYKINFYINYNKIYIYFALFSIIKIYNEKIIINANVPDVITIIQERIINFTCVVYIFLLKLVKIYSFIREIPEQNSIRITV